MIKEDLVKKIATEFNLSLNATARIVQALLDEIINGLVSDSRIEFRRFGVFELKKQKPRVIILPSGEKITRSAKKIITFNSSSCVKKKLNPPTKKQHKVKFLPGRAPRNEL